MHFAVLVVRGVSQTVVEIVSGFSRTGERRRMVHSERAGQPERVRTGWETVTATPVTSS